MGYPVAPEHYNQLREIAENPDPYGRVLEVHRILQQSNGLLKDEPLFAYLGLWAYAEYFSYIGDKYYDEDTLQRLQNFLDHLKTKNIKNFLYHSDSIFHGQFSFPSPKLSELAWAFLKSKLPESFVFFKEKNRRLLLTEHGANQFKFAESPEKVLQIWIRLLEDFPEFENPDNPPIQDLVSIFKNWCLSVPGMNRVLFSDNGVFKEQGIKLWAALADTSFDSTELMRALITLVVEHHAVKKFITGISEERVKAFIELAIMLEPKEFMPLIRNEGHDFKSEISAGVTQALGVNSSYALKDKLKLVDHLSDNLKSQSLLPLAGQYANNHWFMFSAIKNLAMSKEEYNKEAYEKLERDNTENLKNSWTDSLRLLERMIGELEEDQIEPQGLYVFKTLSTTMPSTANFLRSVVSNPIVQSLAHGLDLEQNIRKDLKKMMTEGFEISEPTHSNQMYQFIQSFKQDSFGQTQVTRDHLPLILQERLDKLLEAKVEEVAENRTRRSAAVNPS